MCLYMVILCVHVHTGTHTHTLALAHPHTCGGQRWTTDVCPNHSPLYSLRQSLSLSLELTDSATLAGQHTPRILLSLPPTAEITGHTTKTHSYVGAGRLNLDPCTTRRVAHQRVRPVPGIVTSVLGEKSDKILLCQL